MKLKYTALIQSFGKVSQHLVFFKSCVGGCVILSEAERCCDVLKGIRCVSYLKLHKTGNGKDSTLLDNYNK